MSPLSQSLAEITGSPWPLCTSPIHVAACSVSEPNWECLDEDKKQWPIRHSVATHSAFHTRSRIFSVFKAPVVSSIQGIVPPHLRLTICREFLKWQADQRITIALGIRSAQLILESVILVRRTSDLFPPSLPQLRFFCRFPMGEVMTEIQGAECQTSCPCRDCEAGCLLRAGREQPSGTSPTAGSSFPSATCTP